MDLLFPLLFLPVDLVEFWRVSLFSVSRVPPYGGVGFLERGVFEFIRLDC